jgi:DNA-binding response OmpR family regulator
LLSRLVERLQEIVESPSSVLLPAATSQPQTQGKIVVVDDDLQILSALPKILEPLGLEVVSLSEPQKIWETLDQSMPSLVILDIEMPALTGLDLCQMIRHNRRWSGLPILFLTAHPPHQSQNLAFQAGADDYVTKPIVPSELTTRVLNRLKRVRSLLQSEPHH